MLLDIKSSFSLHFSIANSCIDLLSLRSRDVT